MLVERSDQESESSVGRSSGVPSPGCKLAIIACRPLLQQGQLEPVGEEGALRHNRPGAGELHTVLAGVVPVVHPTHMLVGIQGNRNQIIALALHRQTYKV